MKQKRNLILYSNITSDGIKNLILKVSIPKAEECVELVPYCPVATQADWRYYWDKPEIIKYCEKHFAEAGELARKHDVKVSHP